jgi:putative phosphoesterase
MAIDDYLPGTLSSQSVGLRIGIVSDTHMPYRCRALPGALLKSLQGADLLLHAGDVGELWVLDQLSDIAPVIAVHGNDDSADAQRELPYRQLIHAGGQRMLLWHGHYRKRQEEMAARQGDGFLPKLDRLAAGAEGAGAGIVVFGHWHIPLVYRHADALLINPGAIASGSATTRQLRQTAAALFLENGGTPHLSHIDLANPGDSFVPQLDWDAGFSAALAQYSASILAPDLAAKVPRLRALLDPELEADLVPRLQPLTEKCWQGEFEEITVEMVLNVLQDVPAIGASLMSEIRQILAPPVSQ